MKTSTGKYTLVLESNDLLQTLINKGIITLNNIIVDDTKNKYTKSHKVPIGIRFTTTIMKHAFGSVETQNIKELQQQFRAEKMPNSQLKKFDVIDLNGSVLTMIRKGLWKWSATHINGKSILTSFNAEEIQKLFSNSICTSACEICKEGRINYSCLTCVTRIKETSEIQ